MESDRQGPSEGRFYRPEIDGLRAVAVLSVIFYHVGLGCSGGYVGVDIFFVISGFLITSILLAEAQRKQTISLQRFWVRRIKRLLPALTAVTASIWLVGIFWLLPADFLEMSRSLLWQTCLVANVYFWRTTGYFASAAERKPMLHTWSLSVEEQFYLLLPLLVLLLWRRPKILRAVVLLAFAGSFLVSAFAYMRMPSACFYLLPTRAWELLLGSCLALFPALEPRRASLREATSWLGCLMLAAPIFCYTSSTPFPGPSAVAPCVGALLFIAGNAQGMTRCGRLLSWQPCRYVGLMSYSLYLWHWPVISYVNYARLESLGVAARLTALLLILVLGWVSYEVVEKRFRNSLWLDRQAFKVALAVFLATVGLDSLARYTQGFPKRFSTSFLQAVDITKHSRFNRDLSLQDARAKNFATFGLSQAPPALFVWGDSHAMAVLPGLDEICRSKGIRGLAATHNSSPPILGASLDQRFSQLAEEKVAYNQAVFDAIVVSPARDVLLVGAWEDYFGRDAFPSQIKQTVVELNGRGKRVWILQEVPVHDVDVPHVYAMARLRGRSIADLLRTRAGYLEYSVRSRDAFAALQQKGRILDPLDFFYPDGQSECRLEVKGRLIYRDGGHLSDFGSLSFAEAGLFSQLLQSLDAR